jgi:ABC-2 type transport system ATP-binding protein
VALQGRELRARADAGARAVLAVLASLEHARVEVAAATVTRPSLDDVYLRHVGRTFEEVAR